MTVVFETPGHINPKAFSVFGINSKPNSENPIGFFGTGLKYAIAILVRNNIKVQLFIGDTEYEFYAKGEAFRDKLFSMVRMKKRKGLLGKWKYEALPFTTELGKNWELWQAFREIESNTRDEGGSSFALSEDEAYVTDKDKTLFVITGDEFDEVYSDIDKVFLPEGEVIHSDGFIEIINNESSYGYYRGLRVLNLERDSQYTYNFTEKADLTEDRTLVYGNLIPIYAAKAVLRSHDEEFIKRMIGFGGQTNRFENLLPFDTVSTTPSETFKKVVRNYKGLLSPRVLIAYKATLPKDSSRDLLEVIKPRKDWKDILGVLADQGFEEDFMLSFISELEEKVDDEDCHDDTVSF